VLFSVHSVNTITPNRHRSDPFVHVVSTRYATDPSVTTPMVGYNHTYKFPPHSHGGCQIHATSTSPSEAGKSSIDPVQDFLSPDHGATNVKTLYMDYSN
jgi:hypothetical protein